MRFLMTVAFAAMSAVAAPAMAFFARDPDLDYAALIAEGAGLRDDFWTLSVANADQCKDTTYRLGFEVIALAPDWKSWDRYVEDADLQMGVSIVQVAKGSPAAVAGIQPGDRLVSLAGKAFEPQRKPAKLDKQLEQAGGQVRRRVPRGHGGARRPDSELRRGAGPGLRRRHRPDARPQRHEALHRG